MTAYTKLQIIQIGTDVHIRVWGTRGKHLSDALLTAIQCRHGTWTESGIQTFKTWYNETHNA